MSYDEEMTQEEKDIFHDRTERSIVKIVMFDETDKIVSVDLNLETGKISVFVGKPGNWKEYVALTDLVELVNVPGEEDSNILLKEDFFKNKIFPGFNQFMWDGVKERLNKIYKAFKGGE